MINKPVKLIKYLFNLIKNAHLIKKSSILFKKMSDRHKKADHYRISKQILATPPNFNILCKSRHPLVASNHFLIERLFLFLFRHVIFTLTCRKLFHTMLGDLNHFFIGVCPFICNWLNLFAT